LIVLGASFDGSKICTTFSRVMVQHQFEALDVVHELQKVQSVAAVVHGGKLAENTKHARKSKKRDLSF